MSWQKARLAISLTRLCAADVPPDRLAGPSRQLAEADPAARAAPLIKTCNCPPGTMSQPG